MKKYVITLFALCCATQGYGMFGARTVHTLSKKLIKPSAARHFSNKPSDFKEVLLKNSCTIDSTDNSGGYVKSYFIRNNYLVIAWGGKYEKDADRLQVIQLPNASTENEVDERKLEELVIKSLGNMVQKSTGVPVNLVKDLSASFLKPKNKD